MIFINRKRIIQNSGVIKDPTNYWYIEKYAYGVLKETIEVPLGESVKFDAIPSGYLDDVFYGWSISSTSTIMPFNSTPSYSNTTTTVKNNLDENNTLKIYAVYKYSTNIVSSVYDSQPAVSGHTSTTKQVTYLADRSGTLDISGCESTYNNSDNSLSSTSSIYVSVYDNLSNALNTLSVNGTKTYNIEGGQYLVARLTGGSSRYYHNDSYIQIGSPDGVCFYDFNNGLKYRVESHE